MLVLLLELLFYGDASAFLSCLYKSTGRAIAVTTASELVLALVSALASAFESALLKMLKVFG